MGDARIRLRNQPTVPATSKCNDAKNVPAFIVDDCVEVSGKREALVTLSKQEKQRRQEGADLTWRPPSQELHETQHPDDMRDNGTLEEAVQEIISRHTEIRLQQEQILHAMQQLDQMKHVESTAVEESLQKQIALQSNNVDAWTLSMNKFDQKLTQLHNYSFLAPAQQHLELRRQCTNLETSRDQVVMQLDALLRQKHVDELKCNIFLDRNSLEKQSGAHISDATRCYTRTMIKDSHHNLTQRIVIMAELQKVVLQAYPCAVSLTKQTRHIRRLHSYIAQSANSPLIALIEVQYAMDKL